MQGGGAQVLQGGFVGGLSYVACSVPDSFTGRTFSSSVLVGGGGSGSDAWGPPGPDSAGEGPGGEALDVIAVHMVAPPSCVAATPPVSPTRWVGKGRGGAG